MAIGGLEAATNLAKVMGEYYGEIYPTWQTVYNRFSEGRARRLGTRGYELATEKTGVWTHNFPTDGGALAAGEGVQTLLPIVFATTYNHTVRLTGQAMDDLSKRRKDQNYVDDWAQLNFDNAIRAAHMMCNIYACGDSTGRLATISTGATSATQTVSNNDNTRYMRYGLNVDAVDPNTFVKRTGSPTKVTSDPAPGDTTFTVADAALATTTGDYIVVDGASNRVPTGIIHIADDGTNANSFFQNVDRTSVGRYNAQLLNGNSGSLSQQLLRDLIGAKLAPSVGTLNRMEYEIWSHEAQWSSMVSLGWNLKRFTGESKTLKLGYTAMEFEGMPWVTERDWSKTRVDLIPWKYAWKFETKPWGWDERTGAIFNRVVNTATGQFTSAFEAFYCSTFNFGSPDPRRFAAIYDLSVPSNFGSSSY